MPIPKSDVIWMHGELVPWDDALVHVLTPTLHYGWGVFEGIRAYQTAEGPAVFRLREHMERLMRSARLYPPLDEIEFSVDDLVSATVETIAVNGLESCYIRPTIVLGYGEMGLNPLPSKPQVSIATWTWGTYLGEEAMEHGAKCTISSWRRIGKNTIPPASKTNGQYINSGLAKVDALRAGYDEALLLSEQGYVTEGTGENIFIVKDGDLITPPLSDGPLDGITRQTVMQIARDLGHNVREESIVRTDLLLADEALLTGTAAEVVPIASVDGRDVGSGSRGPITAKIQTMYAEAVRGKAPQYSDWLTPVRT